MAPSWFLRYERMNGGEISSGSEGSNPRPVVVELMKPSLRGGRFNLGGGLPLEVLKDVGGLHRLLVETAKWYLRQQAGGLGQPVPKGFERSFQLNLTSVTVGSADLSITVSNSEAVMDGMEPPYVSVLERASELVVATVGAVANGDDTALNLPAECLRLFAPLGRVLRDGEHIQLATSSTTEPAIYDRTVHEEVMALAHREEATRPVQLRGSVPEADQYRMRFEMHPIGHKRLVSVIPTAHYSTIIDAFNGYQDGVRILIDATGRYSHRERLMALEAVHDIQILDPLDIPTRFEELATLRDGWLNGEGLSPDSDGLRWLSERFLEHYPGDLVPPHLYPTCDGGIQAEWQIGSYELSLDVSLTTKNAEWFAVNTNDSSCAEQDLNLVDQTAWTWLVAELRRISGIAGAPSGG